MDSKADLGKQKKESSSLKTEQWKLSSLRKRKKTDRRKINTVRNLQDTKQCTNICIVGVPEAKERNWADRISEKLIIENFPKFDEKHKHKCPRSSTNTM